MSSTMSWLRLVPKIIAVSVICRKAEAKILKAPLKRAIKTEKQFTVQISLFFKFTAIKQ